MSDVASGIIIFESDGLYRNAFQKPVEREKFELSRDGCQGSSRLVPSTTPAFAIHRRVAGEASSLHAAPSHPPLRSLTLPPSP